METTDKKSALSPEEWLRIIEECKASDLPVTEYCAQTGVGVSHYYRWRRNEEVIGTRYFEHLV